MLTRASVAFILAQAAGIVPALIWNYFIGDRGLDMLRRMNVLKDAPQASETAIDKRARG